MKKCPHYPGSRGNFFVVNLAFSLCFSGLTRFGGIPLVMTAKPTTNVIASGNITEQLKLHKLKGGEGFQCYIVKLERLCSRYSCLKHVCFTKNAIKDHSKNALFYYAFHPNQLKTINLIKK